MTADVAIAGLRFVGAWKRFAARLPSEDGAREYGDQLREFARVADQFLEQVRVCENAVALNALADSLVEISTYCRERSNAESTKPSNDARFPRMDEILHRRREQDKLFQEKQHGVRSEAPSADVNSTQASEERPDTSEACMEFSVQEFTAMLDASDEPTKTSTQDLRRRLGLLAPSRQDSTLSDVVTRHAKESLQSHMVSLAHELKERTTTVNQSLVEDVRILDAVEHSAESNTTLLERENAVLKQQLASSIGLWTSITLVMAALMVFFATYIYIRLFSRRL